MRIIINRSDAIGDFLLTLPVIIGIKKHIPDCQIFLIHGPRVRDLLPFFPWFKDCFCWEKNKTKKIELRRWMKEIDAKAFIHIGGDTTPCFLSRFLNIPFRGGLISRWQTFLTLNKGVRQSRSHQLKHESDWNYELLGPLWPFAKVDAPGKSGLAPVFDLSPELTEKAIEWLATSFPQKGATLVIHPGMSGHTLNWPISHYIELIERILNHNKTIRLVLSFTPTDQRFIDPIKKHFQHGPLWMNRIMPFDGSVYGLPFYIHLLAQADAFIGPSTGTTHLAHFLGTPVLAFYSPVRAQHAKRWGPYEKNSKTIVLAPDIILKPKNKSAWQNAESLMTQITVDQAFKSLGILLRGKI